MGENKNDQQVKNTKADLQQTYGSLLEGRHNREGASARTDKAFEEEQNNPSMKQQNRLNQQDQGSQQREDENYDYERDDELFEHDQFFNRSQMNELQDDNMDAGVEGDDTDILGETENSRRNQQGSKGESNQGNAQNH